MSILNFMSKLYKLIMQGMKVWEKFPKITSLILDLNFYLFKVNKSETRFKFSTIQNLMNSLKAFMP